MISLYLQGKAGLRASLLVAVTVPAFSSLLLPAPAACISATPA